MADTGFQQGLWDTLQDELRQMTQRLEALTVERAQVLERYWRLHGACDLLAQLRQLPGNGAEPREN